MLVTVFTVIKATVFPLVMCGCESWTTKKAEHQRIDTFELWHWRRLLRVPWTARRSNKSILKEISPQYSLTDAEAETPILWPPDAKSWLIRKDPDAKKIEDRWRRRQQRTRWLEGITNSMDMSLSSSRRWWRTGSLAWFSPLGHKDLDPTERLNKNIVFTIGDPFRSHQSLCLASSTVNIKKDFCILFPFIAPKISAKWSKAKPARIFWVRQHKLVRIKFPPVAKDRCYIMISQIL